MYLSVCQALHKATAGSYRHWCRLCCDHVIENLKRLLGVVLLTLAYGRRRLATQRPEERQERQKQQQIWQNMDALGVETRGGGAETCCCYCMQLRENSVIPTTTPTTTTFKSSLNKTSNLFKNVRPTVTSSGHRRGGEREKGGGGKGRVAEQCRSLLPNFCGLCIGGFSCSNGYCCYCNCCCCGCCSLVWVDNCNLTSFSCYCCSIQTQNLGSLQSKKFPSESDIR